MSELVNYSIETDKIVLLSFKDGRSLRVPFKHLTHYLKGADLEKVKKTINLRRHFLRIHMPRFFIILAAIGGAVALLTVGGKTVASLLGHQPAPQQQPASHTGIARSQLAPSPELSPAAAQPAQRDIRLTAAKHTVTQAQASSVQSTATPVPAPPASTPLPLATPAASPMPTPAPSASPSPSPSPTPTGQPTPTKPQVLGASTTTGPAAAN